MPAEVVPVLPRDVWGRLTLLAKRYGYVLGSEKRDIVATLNLLGGSLSMGYFEHGPLEPCERLGWVGRQYVATIGFQTRSQDALELYQKIKRTFVEVGTPFVPVTSIFPLERPINFVQTGFPITEYQLSLCDFMFAAYIWNKTYLHELRRGLDSHTLFASRNYQRLQLDPTNAIATIRAFYDPIIGEIENRMRLHLSELATVFRSSTDQRMLERKAEFLEHLGNDRREFEELAEPSNGDDFCRNTYTPGINVSSQKFFEQLIIEGYSERQIKNLLLDLGVYRHAAHIQERSFEPSEVAWAIYKQGWFNWSIRPVFEALRVFGMISQEVYDYGQLYLRGMVLDMETGRILRQGQEVRPVFGGNYPVVAPVGDERMSDSRDFAQEMELLDFDQFSEVSEFAM
jgi:hypothetical protein